MFRKRDANIKKKTLVLSLDGCLIQTSIFKDEMPRVDGTFKFNSLKVNVCFRPFLKEFILELQSYFELIIWTSSQSEYSQGLIKILEEKIGFDFDYHLTLAD